MCVCLCQFLSNFSQQQMYTFLSFGRLIVLKKLLPFVTICYIVMYLYFTADNSEAETECKVTRSGKYEKVIAGYKKSSPDINWLSNSLYFIYKLQFDFNVVIDGTCNIFCN